MNGLDKIFFFGAVKSAHELTSTELEYIPKILLLSYWGKDIEKLWHKLPQHIRADPEVAEHKPCYQHYNLPTMRHHIDGPPPQIRRCHACIREKNAAKDTEKNASN